MKVKSNFVRRSVAGSHIVIPVGERSNEFNGMITLNPTGDFLWEKLESDTNEDELVKAVLAAYPDTEEAYARSCVQEFVAMLRENDLLE